MPVKNDSIIGRCLPLLASSSASVALKSELAGASLDSLLVSELSDGGGGGGGGGGSSFASAEAAANNTEATARVVRARRMARLYSSRDAARTRFFRWAHDLGG